jgi:hypothetical protein
MNFGISTVVSDYKFYGTSRIGLDSADTTRQAMDSTRAANYMLSNFFENDQKSTDWALAQPNVFFNTPWNSDKVDTDTYLKAKPQSESESSGNDPIQRPFLTVPYIGRGSVNVDLESSMRTGESLDGKQSAKLLSETNYMNLENFPLMPEWVRTSVEEDNFKDSGRTGATTRIF